MIVVSPFVKPGFVDHTYTDHVSVLKFIEYNWRLKPLSARSRDRPAQSESRPRRSSYVPFQKILPL